MGASPIFTFGTLLLLASPMYNRVKGLPNSISHDLNSRGVLKRLSHVASYYDYASQRMALTFGYGHNYQALIPAMLAEIKMMESCPWPVLLP